MSTAPIDIEHWRPGRLHGFVGNQMFREYGEDFIRGVRKGGHKAGYNCFYTGDPRAGKTSGMTYLLQAIGCLDFDFENFRYCDRCLNCQLQHHLTGNKDWENIRSYLDLAEQEGSVDYHVSIVNGPRLGHTNAAEMLEYVQRLELGVKIIYIDEALRMDPQVMASLLSPMDRSSAIWLATSVPRKTPGGRAKRESEETVRIREMFRDRFSFQIETQLPSVEEMAAWLAERCQEFGIVCEDPDSTLRLLAERSRCVAGRALQVLNRAHKKSPPVLKRSLFD